MVEQLICNQQVGGSSPSTGSMPHLTQTEYGGVPEWPKGTDCKSAAYRFDGSNPSSPTTKKLTPFGVSFFVMCRSKDSNNLMQGSGGALLAASSMAATP